MNLNPSYFTRVKPIRSSVSALAAAAAVALALSSTELSAKEAAAASPELKLARSLNQAFIEVADQVAPSVVVIRVQTKNDSDDLFQHPGLDRLPDFFRKQLEEQLEEQRQQQQKRRDGRSKRPKAGSTSPEDAEDAEPQFNGEGSGIVLREEGYILTNNHVVENADKIRVRLKDGREFDAEVRGLDPDSDLAVIKLKGKVSDLVADRFANSDKIRVGEFAIAVGAPFHLDYSVTFGHVSAKGREGIAPMDMWDQQFLQTDARINPGNSGGPLVNIDGEVMGVNSMIRGLESGIGFAIPSNLALEVADRLILDGKLTRSWLGIGIRALRENPDMKEVASKLKDGVVVQSIKSGGPAAKSELEVFDIITAVDGKPVATVQSLRNEIGHKRPNAEVSLKVQRPDKDHGLREITIKVHPEAMPDNMLANVRGRRQEAIPEVKPDSPEDSSTDYLDQIGLTVEPLTKQAAKAQKLDPSTHGLVVKEVEPGSIAERNGLKPGDVITRVGDQKVASVGDLSDALSAGGDSGRIRLRFYRDGSANGLLLRHLPKK